MLPNQLSGTKKKKVSTADFFSMSSIRSGAEQVSTCSVKYIKYTKENGIALGILPLICYTVSCNAPP